MYSRDLQLQMEVARLGIGGANSPLGLWGEQVQSGGRGCCVEVVDSRV